MKQLNFLQFHSCCTTALGIFFDYIIQSSKLSQRDRVILVNFSTLTMKQHFLLTFMFSEVCNHWQEALESALDTESSVAVFLDLAMAIEVVTLKFACHIVSIQIKSCSLICGKCPFDRRNLDAFFQHS